MNKLVLSPHFKKAYKKFVKRNPFLQNQIDDSIRLLEKNIFDERLKTHKLSGALLGCHACSCGYDCRIIFTIEQNANQNIVLLITLGTHEEVY